MKVSLLHHTPLWVCSTAIRKCWASEGKSDSFTYDASCDPVDLEDGYVDGVKYCGPKDKELIHRIANKNKHASTIEHLSYSFDIDGISRACLQELARHRHASMSVKSTRYTLKELRSASWGDLKHFLVAFPDGTYDTDAEWALNQLQQKLWDGMSNDKAKYCLPEAYKTSLVWTINARALQNFLELRTSRAALWEIRDLAYNIYDELPDEHKYLFKEFVKEREE